jgi:hypothetical protein
MRSSSDLYRFHVANNRLVGRALDHISLGARVQIRRSDDDGVEVDVYVRLYALVLAAWAESRLSKLLYETPGFNSQQRTAILAKGSQFERWNAAVDMAFRTRYEVRRAALTTRVLPYSAFARYQAISQMLINDLQRVIELRNKLAHGQWVYPLNEANDDVATEHMQALMLENLLSLQYKRQLVAPLGHHSRSSCVPGRVRPRL